MDSLRFINKVLALFIYSSKVFLYFKVQEKKHHSICVIYRMFGLLRSAIYYKKSQSSGIMTYSLSNILVHIPSLHIGTSKFIIII